MPYYHQQNNTGMVAPPLPDYTNPTYTAAPLPGQVYGEDNSQKISPAGSTPIFVVPDDSDWDEEAQAPKKNKRSRSGESSCTCGKRGWIIIIVVALILVGCGVGIHSCIKQAKKEKKEKEQEKKMNEAVADAKKRAEEARRRAEAEFDAIMPPAAPVNLSHPQGGSPQPGGAPLVSGGHSSNGAGGQPSTQEQIDADSREQNLLWVQKRCKEILGPTKCEGDFLWQLHLVETSPSLARQQYKSQQERTWTALLENTERDAQGNLYSFDSPDTKLPPAIVELKSQFEENTWNFALKSCETEDDICESLGRSGSTTLYKVKEGLGIVAWDRMTKQDDLSFVFKKDGEEVYPNA